MKRTPVKSSNIKSVGYDPASQTLEVEFASGGVHQYAGVSTAQHAALLKAKSIGQHFHREIRTTHKAKQV
jgi:hypothetical protein